MSVRISFFTNKYISICVVSLHIRFGSCLLNCFELCDLFGLSLIVYICATFHKPRIIYIIQTVLYTNFELIKSKWTTGCGLYSGVASESHRRTKCKTKMHEYYYPGRIKHHHTQTKYIVNFIYYIPMWTLSEFNAHKKTWFIAFADE